MIKYEESCHGKIAAERSEAGNFLKAGDDQYGDKRRDGKKKHTSVTLQSVAPQNRHIESVIQQFLCVHWDRQKPLLLGYSGGHDSKTLLYALLECGVRPTLAHVDHGWRIESQEEAVLLQKEAEILQLPFLSTRLTPKDFSEEEARRERYAFFASLAPHYAALLLAHQADDLAETVLKRVFEGAHLAHLGGMQEVSVQYGMPIWRPLLRVKRAEILQFLEERSLLCLKDRSNDDPAYLRTRMRQEMFPFLQKCFGKEIVENLHLLSQRAFELKEYLDARVQHALPCKGPWGTLVDLQGLAPLEQRHLLQSLLRLNRDQLHTLMTWLEQGAVRKTLSIKTKKILVDKGRVWIFSGDVKDLNPNLCG